MTSSSRERPNVVDVMLARIKLVTFKVASDNRASGGCRNIAGPLRIQPPDEKAKGNEEGKKLRLRWLDMDDQWYGDCAKRKHNHGLCEIPDKQPSTLPRKSERPKPIKRDQKPCAEDKPIGIGDSGYVYWRLGHSLREGNTLLGFMYEG